MDPTTAKIVAAIVLAVLLVVFIVRYGGRGKIRIRTLLGEASAEGEHQSPTHRLSGVKVKDAAAGRDLMADSRATGGVELDKVTAKRDLTAKHTPESPSPKA